ncbi:MAG: Crp/Fnr family transcriptional regulator [Chromatiales bacterium]|jgi:CRP-like cAMP-binding protein
MKNTDLLTRIWNGAVNCRKCGIRELVLFSKLDADDFNHIHLPIYDYFYPQSHQIYQAGEVGKHVYTIRSGIVKLEVENDSGEKRIVRLLGKGDAIGLEAIIGEPYRHFASVLGPGDFCEIPVEVIENLRHHSPHLCEELLLRWDRSLQLADEWLASMHTGNARQKVLKLIQHLAENTDDSSEFILPSRDEMSSILVLSSETVSRIVADLKRENIIWDLGNGFYEFRHNPTSQ